MPDYRAYLADVRTRREMFVGTSSYEALVAFLMGLNEGNEGGVLVGFNEWLAVKADGYDHLHWGALALHVVFPEEENPRALIARSGETQEAACMGLFDLLASFHQECIERGLRRIFVDYEDWLNKQES